MWNEVWNFDKWKTKLDWRTHGSINNDLNFSLEYSPSYNDSLSTLNLLHAFYVSNENKKWINLSEELESENLGKSNQKISNLYRI